MVLRQVSSPNEARVYGTGEVIVIEVTFNHAVVLYGEPTLLLETGVFNQEVSQAHCSSALGIESPLHRPSSCSFYVSLVIRSRKS